MHHKEVCLAVDTAKLILSTFPESCRLVIGGISSEHQESMKEFEEAMKGSDCLVLFPTESARTFCQIRHEQEVFPKHGWDIVVIDGTWAQARKLHSRYIQEGTAHVELSTESVSRLGDASETCKEGHQLRRHPIKWKEVSTLEATRLLLRDMMSSTTTDRPWDTLALYQQIGDAAAKRQLGPHR
jgi:DTW domain-containing protein YfiP